MGKDAIRYFRKILRRFERLNQLMNTHCCQSVTVAQCHVLLEIEELTEATTIQLAKNLKLDKSTLSRTVDGLVKSGLVGRKAFPSDRRYTNLILTELGVKTCESIHVANDTLYEMVLQKLPQVARDSMIEHLESLVEAMEDWYQTSKADGGCCK